MSVGYVWRENQNGFVLDRSKVFYDWHLEDLREWNILLVHCPACKWIGEVYPSALQRRFRGHERIAGLQRGLKCGRCGNREGNHWQVYRIGRNR